ATRGLLQFAATNDAAFHYVSTLAVLPRAGRDAISTERIYLEHEALRDGYQQSKWHAEQLCARASQAGLTTTVHRLGRVTGSRSRPWVNPQDILWRVARASTNVQAWPELDFKETWSPVDEVADTMSALIVREQCKQRGTAPDVFHLAHHEPVHVWRLARALMRLGCFFPVDSVPE